MTALERKFVLLLTVFIAALSILNVISAKLFVIGGLSFPLSAGILCYWITFPITDIVSEVYGKAHAQFLVWMGFLANVIILLISQVAIQLPPADFYTNQEGFAATLGAVPIIVCASLAAYLAAQTHDVWAYHFWKKVTGNKHMWLRNNLSTITSQLLDSLVFNGIAFFIFGDWTLGVFISSTLAFWALKLAIAIIDTPIVYLLHRWLTGHWSPSKAAAQQT